MTLYLMLDAVEVVDGMIEKIEGIVSSPYFKLFVALLVIFLICLIIRKIYIALRTKRLGNLVYERHFSETGVYEGDEVEIVETVRNTKFFPLFGVDIESYFYNELELEEYEGDGKDGMQYIISRFNLLPYMQIKRRHTVKCARRGHYSLHVASIYTKNGPLTLEAPAEIYVYPRLLPIDMNDLATGRLQGEFSSTRPLYTDPFSFSGIRDYRFGDQMSQINFKASAKYPETSLSCSPFKVNARDFCANRRMMIYMDIHIERDSGIDGEEYERLAEYGLSLCASMVNDAIFGGFSVGFAANCKTVDGEMSVRFPCESGRHHMTEILRQMACLRMSEGASFASVLDDAVSTRMSDTEVVVVCFSRTEDALLRLDTLERYGNTVNYIVLNEGD